MTARPGQARAETPPPDARAMIARLVALGAYLEDRPGGRDDAAAIRWALDTITTRKERPLTKEEQELLLTTARILRAVRPQMKQTAELAATCADDMWALNEALKPFGPINVVPMHPNTANS